MSTYEEEGIGGPSYCCCVVIAVSFRNWVGQEERHCTNNVFCFMKKIELKHQFILTFGHPFKIQLNNNCSKPTLGNLQTRIQAMKMHILRRET